MRKGATNKTPNRLTVYSRLSKKTSIALLTVTQFPLMENRQFLILSFNLFGLHFLSFMYLFSGEYKSYIRKIGKFSSTYS